MHHKGGEKGNAGYESLVITISVIAADCHAAPCMRLLGGKIALIFATRGIV